MVSSSVVAAVMIGTALVLTAVGVGVLAPSTLLRTQVATSSVSPSGDPDLDEALQVSGDPFAGLPSTGPFSSPAPLHEAETSAQITQSPGVVPSPSEPMISPDPPENVHNYLTSEDWKRIHVTDLSYRLEPGHQVDSSLNDHAPTLSTTWDQPHEQSVSAEVWPPDHSRPRSASWNNHTAIESQTWPPEHGRETSASWRGDHAASVSASWPPRHWATHSRYWPDDHAASTSKSWPGGDSGEGDGRIFPPHRVATSAEYDDGHSVNLSHAWPPNHIYSVSVTWAPRHDSETSYFGDAAPGYFWPPNHLLAPSLGWLEVPEHDLYNSFREWPPNHEAATSLSWKRGDTRHARNQSALWPRNHEATTSRSQIPALPSDGSSLWPKFHRSIISMTWPPDHQTEYSLEGWVPNHSGVESATWRDRSHTQNLSVTWPPGHDYVHTSERRVPESPIWPKDHKSRVSQGWETGRHTWTQSALWPIGHEYSWSATWPRQHTLTVSSSWEPNRIPPL